MPTVFTDLAQSKKFVFVFAVTVISLISAKFGVLSKTEVLSILGVLWPVYLGAQGFSDVGDKLANAHMQVQAERQDGITADVAKRHELLTTLIPLIPTIMENLGRTTFGAKIGGDPFGPASLGLLKKGDKVLHIILGPDDIGVVQEDQEADPSLGNSGHGPVRVLFASNTAGADTYDSLDLIKVPMDYVGPSAGAATAAAAKPIPKPAAASAQGTA